MSKTKIKDLFNKELKKVKYELNLVSEIIVDEDLEEKKNDLISGLENELNFIIQCLDNDLNSYENYLNVKENNKKLFQEFLYLFKDNIKKYEEDILKRLISTIEEIKLEDYVKDPSEYDLLVIKSAFVEQLKVFLSNEINKIDFDLDKVINKILNLKEFFIDIVINTDNFIKNNEFIFKELKVSKEDLKKLFNSFLNRYLFDNINNFINSENEINNYVNLIDEYKKELGIITMRFLKEQPGFSYDYKLKFKGEEFEQFKKSFMKDIKAKKQESLKIEKLLNNDNIEKGFEIIYNNPNYKALFISKFQIKENYLNFINKFYNSKDEKLIKEIIENNSVVNKLLVKVFEGLKDFYNFYVVMAQEINLLNISRNEELINKFIIFYLQSKSGNVLNIIKKIINDLMELKKRNVNLNEIISKILNIESLDEIDKILKEYKNK